MHFIHGIRGYVGSHLRMPTKKATVLGKLNKVARLREVTAPRVDELIDVSIGEDYMDDYPHSPRTDMSKQTDRGDVATNVALGLA
ncbi:hypothetical protein GW17_00004075 [Ensete ventricosum]|nr:hypothetical protein GW17_00004075 [Ensete ventricosum]RZR78404.1 hypothetical protein BHM03_00003734 [Ensete ventricosum]